MCANNVATWLIETVGFEGNPAAGFGMTASVFANSLSKAELNDLAAIMELYKNNLIENPSALLNEIRTTLSENGAYKIVYDRANNTIIKQINAGKGTSGVINTVRPNTLSELNSDLISKGFQLKGTSGGGYTTYKHPDGRIVTIKPTGEVIPTKPKIAENGKKYNERTDYEFNRLEDQSHSTNHFIDKDK